MQTEKKAETKPRKKTRTRKLLTLSLIILAVLILSVVVLLPIFVSSEKVSKTILAKINDSIDGQADFADLSMGWFKGIKITNISFNDNQGRVTVAVKQISTKPHYASVLTGALSLGETVIDEPKIRINLDDSQPAEKPTQTSQDISVDESPTVIVLPVKKIDLLVNNGDLKVTSSPAQTVQLSNINSRVNLRPPGKLTAFDMDMTIVGADDKSKISAEGQITPDKKLGWTLEGTSGDVIIEIDDLDLGSLAPLFALAGVELKTEGRIFAEVKTEIEDGQVQNLNANLRAKNLDVTGGQLGSDRLKISELDATVKLTAAEELINIEMLQINSDWLTAQASGDVPKTFESLAEFIKTDSKSNLNASFECNLAAAMSQMPQTFGLKEQIQITSGQLTGSVETFVEAGRKVISSRANLANLAGTVQAKTIALTEPVTVTAEITSDKAGIKYDRLNLSAAFVEVNGTGTNELLEFNADVDLAKLQAELGQFVDLAQYQMAGKVSCQAKVAAKEDKINIAGSSAVKDLHLTTPNKKSVLEPQADINFSVGIDQAKDIVNIDYVNTKTSFGQVNVEDSTLPLGEDSEEPVKLTVSASDINLEKLQPVAAAFVDLPPDMELAGIAESKLTLNSKKDLYTIATDSTKIKNLKITTPNQKPFEQEQVQLVFDGDINLATSNLLIRQFELTSPDIKIKGDFEKSTQGDKTKLKGSANLEYDWAAVSAMAAPFLPAALEMQGQRSDAISFESEYPTDRAELLLPNLDTEAKLGFTKADYMGLAFGPTELDVQIKKGRLEIKPFSTEVNKGRLNFAAKTNFNQKPALLKTPGKIYIAKDIHIDDRISSELLKYVNAIFAGATKVTGIANFECDTLAIPIRDASKKDMVLEGTLSITDMRLGSSGVLNDVLSVAGINLRDQKMQIRPTKIVVKDGILSYDNMQLDVGDNPFNFVTRVDLETLNIEGSKIITPFTLDGTIRIDSKETADKRIALSLGGTVDNPEVDLGKLVGDQVEQLLREELRKGLEGLFK